MYDFEKAKKKAKRLRPDVNTCEETQKAFIFGRKNDLSFGGNEPVVIIKATGEALGMTAYIDEFPGDDTIQEIEF